MKSLTVFDPKKVFTEVIKLAPTAMQQGLAVKLTMLVAMQLAILRSCKHIKSFSTRTLYARTLKVLGFMHWDKRYPSGSFRWACLQKKKRPEIDVSNHYPDKIPFLPDLSISPPRQFGIGVRVFAVSLGVLERFNV